MTSLKLITQIDFSFDDRLGKYPTDWIFTRMGIFGEYFGGATPATDQPSFWDGTINWLVPSDISSLGYEQHYIFDTADKLTDAGYNSASTKLLPIGTVSMSSRATLGDCVILGKEMCTNQGFINIVCNEKMINKYLLYWIRQNKNYISRYAAGTTFLEIGRRQFKKLRVAMPEPSEQKRIVDTLEEVDNSIRSTKTTIEKSEYFKKTLMQNLLSGRLKPDGAWRNQDEFYVDEKIGKVPKNWRVYAVADPEIVDLDPNYKYTKDKEYPFLPMDAVDEGFQGIREVEYRKIDGGGYSRFKNGDIIYAKITPCVENGKVALVEDIEGDLGFGSTEFIVLSPKPTIDKNYLYYQVISGNVHRLAISLMEGTTARQRIPAKIFRNRIFIPVPNDLEEQKQISEKIRAVENLISAKQQKIRSLEAIKKSLMQNLLTGKMRVHI